MVLFAFRLAWTQWPALLLVDSDGNETVLVLDDNMLEVYGECMVKKGATRVGCASLLSNDLSPDVHVTRGRVCESLFGKHFVSTKNVRLFDAFLIVYLVIVLIITSGSLLLSAEREPDPVLLLMATETFWGPHESEVWIVAGPPRPRPWPQEGWTAVGA